MHARFGSLEKWTIRGLYLSRNKKRFGFVVEVQTRLMDRLPKKLPSAVLEPLEDSFHQR
jgi:hypothetical protein